jgi:hypothetical protein
MSNARRCPHYAPEVRFPAVRTVLPEARAPGLAPAFEAVLAPPAFFAEAFLATVLPGAGFTVTRSPGYETGTAANIPVWGSWS